MRRWLGFRYLIYVLYINFNPINSINYEFMIVAILYVDQVYPQSICVNIFNNTSSNVIILDCKTENNIYINYPFSNFLIFLKWPFIS